MNSTLLKTIVPAVSKINVMLYPPILAKAMAKWGINTHAQQTAFLAQLAHESGSFNYVREIASGAAYEGRKDLGNIYAGDGVRFKGRGLIQITGRTNYRACSIALYGDDRLVKNPKLLEEPNAAVESACWFWTSRGLNEIANYPDTWTHTVKLKDGSFKTYTKFQWITKRINGGQNGLADREAFYARAKKHLPHGN